MFDSTSVVYEVFPRYYGSFKRMTEDLQRIRELGVDVLMMMPFHPVGEKKKKGEFGSPYAIKDFFSVDPELGTLQDLGDFLSRAHELGFRVLYDAIIGHVALDSEIVIKHPEWIVTDEEGEMVPPDEEWWDVVKVNLDNPDALYYMVDVLNYWKDFGFDGFRGDAAAYIPIETWVTIKDLVDPAGDLMWVGEVQIYEYSQVFDVLYNHELYEFARRLWNREITVHAFMQKFWQINDIYSDRVLLLNYLETHDTDRVANYLTEPELLHWVVFYFFIPGVPLITMGQEYAEIKRMDIFSTFGGFEPDAPGSWFRIYKALSRLRKMLGVWAEGEVVPLRIFGAGATAVLRYTDEGEYLLGLFRLSDGEGPVKVEVGTKWDSGVHKWQDLISGQKVEVKGVGDGFVEIELSAPRVLIVPEL